MAYALGIDIGTTFSAAAVAFDDGRVELVNLGGRAPSIPSVIVVREQGEILVGDAAETRAAMDPARVAREFKRRLGDPTPLILGSTPYSAEALTAMLLRHIVEVTTRRMGGPPQSVVITHPASYTAYRLDLLRNAAIEAGIDAPQLVSEPHAAAAQYASTGRVVPGEIVAVYDFGGGTFDIALLRLGPTGFDLISAPVGVDRLGGIDFDLAVLQHVNDAVDGRLDALDTRDEQTLQILAKLRRDSREAKESLSSDDEVAISVIVPGTTRSVRVSRALFESMIRPRLEETFSALRRVVDAAGIRIEDIGRIVLVGGSSRIPLIRDEVRVRTGRPIAEDVDPEYAVALGAARHALRALGEPLADAGRPAPPPPPASSPAAPFVATSEATDSASRRRGRLIAAVEALLLVVGGVVAFLVTRDGGDETGADPETTTEETAETEPDDTSDGTGPETSATATESSAAGSVDTALATTAPPETETTAQVGTTSAETTAPATTLPGTSLDVVSARAALVQGVTSFTFAGTDPIQLVDCPFGPLGDIAQIFSGVVTVAPASTGAQLARVDSTELGQLLECNITLTDRGGFLVVYMGAFDPAVELDVSRMLNPDAAPVMSAAEPHDGGEMIPYCEDLNTSGFSEACGAVWVESATGLVVGIAFAEAGVSETESADALRAVLPTVIDNVITSVPIATEGFGSIDSAAALAGLENLVGNAGLLPGSATQLADCPLAVPIGPPLVDLGVIATDGDLEAALNQIQLGDGTTTRDHVLCTATVGGPDTGAEVAIVATVIRPGADPDTEILEIIGDNREIQGAPTPLFGGEVTEFCSVFQGDPAGCGALWVDPGRTIALSVVLDLRSVGPGTAPAALEILLPDLAAAAASLA